MANKKDSKNPFGLLKKESRTLAATVGTEALNNDNYKTSLSLEPDTVVTPPDKADNSNTEQSVSKATVIKPVEPSPVESSPTESSDTESSPIISENTVDSLPDKELQNNRVGGGAEKKEAKVKKKPGPKKSSDDEATTVTRISARGNKLLNLLAKIEDKNHITFLDDLLMMHPLYNKVNGLL